MWLNTRLQLALWLCAVAGLLLAGCRTAALAATATTVVKATATQPAATQSIATSSPSATATPAPATPTASPSDTAVPSPTATDSPTAAASPTATARPTATDTPPAPTATARPPLTRAPVTITPLGPPLTVPVVSTTGGPKGYTSRIQCQRVGAPCAPFMPPGEVSFHLSLAGDSSAPWTHFVYYGLSVEKDGANVASLFMFVDAGWLQPGAVVGFGASRNFAQPGTYVIRSSGCLTTDVNTNNCGWATIAGDVITFVIQPF